jgi:hypothetical protein
MSLRKVEQLLCFAVMQELREQDHGAKVPKETEREDTTNRTGFSLHESKGAPRAEDHRATLRSSTLHLMQLKDCETHVDARRHCCDCNCSRQHSILAAGKASKSGYVMIPLHSGAKTRVGEAYQAVLPELL